MDEKLTPWFPGSVKPARPEVYERDFVDGHIARRFAEWTGVQWLVGSGDVKTAAKRDAVSGLQLTLPWRGLAEDPNKKLDPVLKLAYGAPIDMVLHCPACGKQHIDGPDDQMSDAWAAAGYGTQRDGWTNPPHKSHLCHSCGHIWRPADVPTNGVADTKTHGKNDSPKGVPR